jgi:hypothetical protein
MRLRGARNVARMGDERNASLKLVRIFKGKILLGRFRSRWDNIVKSTLNKQDGMKRNQFIMIRTGPVAGSCEHGNGPSGCRWF